MPRATLKTDPTNSNQSTERLLTLMEFLSRQPEPLRLLDIAKMCEMNTSTVLRFLTALQAKGYVAQDGETGRYCLTFKLCRLGSNVKSHADIRNISLPYLRGISQEFGESVSLMVECDMSVMHLETAADTSQMLMSMQRIGSLAPMHCTDAGKLFLTSYSPSQLDRLVAAKGLPWHTEHTITTLDRLRREFVQIRMQGYAYDNEEFELGVRCIAAPIRDYTDQIIAAVSVSGPVARMTNELLYNKLPFLLESSAKISVRLGHEPQKDAQPSYRR